MACNCVPNVITVDNTTCDDCLKVVSLRYLCSEGPAPCGGVGGTLTEDLAAFNDVTACGCGTVKYTIDYFDPEGFSSVTTTDAGVMTAITTSNYTDKKEYLITYKVDCPCSILAGTGNIYVCMKNLCAGVDCLDTEYCDPCDGLCKTSNSDLDISGGGVTANSGGGTGFA